MSAVPERPPYRTPPNRRLACAIYRFRVRRRLRRQGVDVALWESWQQSQRAGLVAMTPEDFVRPEEVS